MSDSRFIAGSDGVHKISGHMTFETVPDLLAHTAVWVTSGDKAITLDLQQVTHVDSAGMALMMEWLRRAKAAGRELQFVNLPEQARNLIRISGLKGAFQLD